MNAIRGIAASPGIAIGTAVIVAESLSQVSFRQVAPEEVGEERARLEAALAESAAELTELRDASAATMGREAAAIFDFHLGLLKDRSLVGAIVADIEREQVCAEYAASENFVKFADRLRALPDPMFQERAGDVVDLERRVVSKLIGASGKRLKDLGGPAVVIAHELTPSQTAEFHRAKVVAFATDAGGLTGHTSIIARALAMPAVVGCKDATAHVEDGDVVIVDGDAGQLVIRPDEGVLAHYRALAHRSEARRGALREGADLPSVTRDGTAINLLGNIEFPDEITSVLANGGSGVGLYRTEFLYLTSPRVPTEEEHYRAYARAVELCAGRTLVIRTLDLGADKYTQEHLEEPERNPFLGLRSIRFCLQNPALFRTQLRALLRASALGPIKVMLPLVSNVMELRQTRMMVHDLCEDLDEEGIRYDRNLQIGIMIEVPSAALMARTLATESAFFSVGTNDLIQYTLAVDRGNERVAPLYNGANPAVLTLIKASVRAAANAGIDCSLCGELAGEPLFTCLLLGFGFRTLSMAPAQIPAVKRVVRATTIEHCELIARKVGSFDSDRQVLSYLRDELRKVDPDAVNLDG